MDPAAIIALIIHYRYWIVFPLACFEGPILAFIVGTLIALGYFNPIVVYMVLILGDVIPDAIYYFLGRYGENKPFVKRIIEKAGVSSEHFDVLRRLWYKHTAKTMFFTKVAYGLSTPLLVSGGFVRVPFSKFFLYSLGMSFLQYAVFLSLGYYFSNSFQLVSKSFERIQIFIAAVVIVAAAYYIFTIYMRKKLLEVEKREEGMQG